jgi:hypothetical protein
MLTLDPTTPVEYRTVGDNLGYRVGDDGSGLLRRVSRLGDRDTGSKHCVC